MTLQRRVPASSHIYAQPISHRNPNPQSSRLENNGDGNIIEDFVSGPRKRQSQILFCSAETCGTVGVSDCLQAVKNIAAFGQYYPTNNIIFTPFAGDCVVSVENNDKQFCTSASQLAAPAHKVFNACVNDTAVRSNLSFCGSRD